MTATLDYGCVAYMSAAESHLKKLDMEQPQALRICSGPLKIRRMRLMLTHWINLQEHCSSHPAKALLEDCWEHNKTQDFSFG